MAGPIGRVSAGRGAFVLRLVREAQGQLQDGPKRRSLNARRAAARDIARRIMSGELADEAAVARAVEAAL